MKISCRFAYGLAFLLALFVLFVTQAVAQVTNAAGGLGELPSNTSAYWDYAIAAISPIVVWLVRKVAPSIPTVLLPVMTPFVGLALGFALNKLFSANLSWVDMAKAGAMAVFVREVVNQAITQRLNPDPEPTTKSARR